MVMETTMNGARNRQEFEQQYTQSHKRAYNLAYRMLGNSAEAEDVTQDAFVRAWQSFNQYDRSRPFEAWLFRIVTNLAIDRRRRWNRLPIYSLDAPITHDSDGEPFHLELADPKADPEQAMLKDRFNEVLERALHSLPPEYRAAVLLADVEGRSYQEIAEIMDCAIGTVRSRIHRARNLLRRALEDARSFQQRRTPKSKKIAWAS
jgi:RNA polymerase sigma-70 factor (ECF subfamily)